MSVDSSKTSCASLKNTVNESNAQILNLDQSKVNVDIPPAECTALGRRRRLATVNVNAEVTASGSKAEIASAQSTVESRSFASRLVSTMKTKDSSFTGMTASAPSGVEKKDPVIVSPDAEKGDGIGKVGATLVDESCFDVRPPRGWRVNTCQKQQDAGKCPKRKSQDSKYCRKTCGMCGVPTDAQTPAATDALTPAATDAPTPAPDPECFDVQPPRGWNANTCQKQQEKGKCPKRKSHDSKYCRKTCGTC